MACTVINMFMLICLQYDGGAPLLCKTKGKTKLYGLTMAGYGISRYCDEGRSMFTRISMHYQWIKKNAESLQGE